MPRGDGTGPIGMGPMSGRRAGYCAGNEAPGYVNAAPGYGFGQGRGCRGFHQGAGRRGWRTWFRASRPFGWMRSGRYGSQEYSPDPDYEREALKRKADMLQAEMESIRKRLGETDTPSAVR